VPYHGIISAVDKNAKTFTIEGRRDSRVLKIIEGTPITKGGETATIDDLNKDDEVSGSYLKDADGTLLARTVKIGPVKRKETPTPTPTASPRRR
jgi:glucosamine 6-phosphate synthetase-like amidotransferase/phosphosugar isomerase protein